MRIEHLKITGLLISALLFASACNSNDDKKDNDNVPIDGEDQDDGDYTFAEFDWLIEEPDMVVDRLCAESASPDTATGTVNVDCALEGASFSDTAPDRWNSGDQLIVMAYNLERGHFVDEQIETILTNDSVPVPDIILISESDRGCERTGYRNVMRDYAEALGYYYIYGVEYIELYTDSEGVRRSCEHGNGIVSRFPLGNAELIRHSETDTWSGRLGGRMTVHADADIGGRYLHLYALHLSSGADETDYRKTQVDEILHNAADQPFPVLVGGDTNAWVYSMDLASDASNDQVIVRLTEAGYYDSHRELPYSERITLSTGLILDLIFSNRDFFSDPHVCPAEVCEGLSDHLPIWVSITP